MYRQYDLRSDDARLTCWLEQDSRVREGSLITLKGDVPERWWEVVTAYKTLSDKPPEKRWRVGGLL